MTDIGQIPAPGPATQAAGGHRRLLASSGPAELYALARRVLGLQYLNPADFTPAVTAEDTARLQALSRAARGPAPPPILVFGVMPRSGTNFVRDVLALHAHVAPDPGRIYEFPLLHAAGSARAHMDRFLAMFPRNTEVLSRWDALALLAGAWLRVLQGEAGDRRILLKCPHVQNLSLAPLIFPDAKLVLVLRDGRDVLDSTLNTFSRRSLARKTFAQLAREWALGAEAMVRVASADTSPHIHLLRYEALVEEGGPAVERLLRAVDLDPAGFDFDGFAALPVRGSSRAQAEDATRWDPQARGADFKPVARWKSWDAKRKARFDKIAGAALEAAGYDRGT
ncbi:MAG: sulfotransferase [Pseudomonadota bacterium]